ncbi:MAG: type I glyceraldehyde-3-phosphate dehydrogenase [bacterium]|nr:type I glyceraldehyde-3-phosphate dehydrogenase [bacterium]
MIKVAINGFGRIGRVAFRAACERYGDKIEIVAINTSGSMDAHGWAHLLKYDSVYGRFREEIGVMDGGKGEIGRLIIGGRIFPVLAEKVPGKIPWEKYQTDVVLESTGIFLKTKDCEGHLKAGAKKVIISAPAKDKDTPTYVIGANAHLYKGERIVSNASCTTNCIAPLVKIMKENFKVGRVSMTTIHAYTADQELVDGSHKDLRRARSAALNIVPTSTGAAEALGRVLPSVQGNFAGMAIRVPVACGSLADFIFILDHSARAEKVNHVFDQAAGGEYAGIVEATYDPIVSSDIVGSSASATVDLSLTEVVGGNMVKVVAWYDNEYGYACRLVELAGIIGGQK